MGMPVAVFVAITFAPGTTAPLESRTVPRIEDVSFWARAGAAVKMVITATRHRAAPSRFLLLRRLHPRIQPSIVGPPCSELPECPAPYAGPDAPALHVSSIRFALLYQKRNFTATCPMRGRHTGHRSRKNRDAWSALSHL